MPTFRVAKIRKLVFRDTHLQGYSQRSQYLHIVRIFKFFVITGLRQLIPNDHIIQLVTFQSTIITICNCWKY